MKPIDKRARQGAMKIKKLNLKFADDLEFVKNLVGMWSILQLNRQVLTRPMLVVLAPCPEPGSSNVVYQVVVGYPYFGFVLAVP